MNGSDGYPMNGSGGYSMNGSDGYPMNGSSGYPIVYLSCTLFFLIKFSSLSTTNKLLHVKINNNLFCSYYTFRLILNIIMC